MRRPALAYADLRRRPTARVLILASTMSGAVSFTWDPSKARSNRAKHGVSFDEAATVFADPEAQFYADLVHPKRGIVIGHSSRERLLIVVHIDMTTEVRIISARKATSHERKTYEEG